MQLRPDLNLHFHSHQALTLLFTLLRTYQFRRLHLVVNRQIQCYIRLGLSQDLRHFAYILNIHDAQILRIAAFLGRIRCHGQPVRSYLIDIALIDSFRRCCRIIRIAFIVEHRCAIYRARSAFFRCVHVHPVGTDAFARFEDKVRPFTFNEY